MTLITTPFGRHSTAADGVHTSAPIVDLEAVIQRKRSVVESAQVANLHTLETTLGDDLIIGTARFMAPKMIEVTNTESNTRHLTAERLFINTGTRSLIPQQARSLSSILSIH